MHRPDRLGCPNSGPLGYGNEHQAVLRICHVPVTRPHRFICHKPGARALLPIHFTGKETKVQGKARESHAAFSDSVFLVAKA